MGTVFQRLLLATEHSEYDEGAEAVAMSLARQLGLPLAAVLPLTSNPEFESIAPQLAARAEAEAATKGDALQATAAAAGVQLAWEVRRGPEPFLEIVEACRRLPADLLVIRRRGKRGLLANLLVGEMVGKVLAHAPCSVLVAARGARLGPGDVMVAIDPLQPMPSLVDRAVDVAHALGRALMIVSVAVDATRRPLADAAVAAAVQAARQRGAEARGQARTGRPHEELLAASRECGCGLAVIARHGPQSIARAWIGSVAQKVTGLAEGPVLIHVPNA